MIIVALGHVEQQVALRAPSAVSLVAVVEGEHAAFLVVSVEVLVEGHADGCDSLIVIAAFLSATAGWLFHCSTGSSSFFLSLAECLAKELEQDVEQQQCTEHYAHRHDGEHDARGVSVFKLLDVLVHWAGVELARSDGLGYDEPSRTSQASIRSLCLP